MSITITYFEGPAPDVVATIGDALDRLQRLYPDVIFSHTSLPDEPGLWAYPDVDAYMTHDTATAVALVRETPPATERSA